jgi:hypothetical protein
MLRLSRTSSSRVSPLASAAASAIVVVSAFVVLQGCEIAPPTNPFDPATPPDLQAAGSLRGAVVLRDAAVGASFVGEREALAQITIGLRDSEGRPLTREGAVLARSLIVDEGFDDNAARGTFGIDDLTPGSYSLVLSGLPESYGVPPVVVVTIGAGQQADVGDLAFDYTIDDDGFVIDGQIDPDDAAGGLQTVSLFRVDGTADDPVVSFVDNAFATGSFRFAGLLPGTYGLFVEGDDQMPAWRLDVPVNSQQPQTSFADDATITLHPVTAVLLPITSGDGAVINVEGENYVRDAPVPLAVLGFANDAAAEVGVTRMRLSTSPEFTDVPEFSLYAPSAAVVLSPFDGRQTIYAQFRAESTAGFSFTSSRFSIDVVRDTVAPEVTTAEVPGAPLADGVVLSATRTVPLRVVVNDTTSAVAGFGVGIDSVPDALANVFAAPGDVQFDETLTFAADGEHTLFVVARDRAGNDTFAAPTHIHVLVDTIEPDVTFTIDNATGGLLPDANAELLVVSNIPGDDELLVGFGFEGQPITPDTALVDSAEGPRARARLRLPADALPGGSFTFEAVVVDAVGNETRVTQTVNLPPAPAAPRLVINDGAAFTNSREVRLRLAAQDFTSVCVESDDESRCFDGDDVVGEVPFTLSTSAGEAVVNATFFNTAGYSATTSDSIVVDLDRPTLVGSITLDDGTGFATSLSTTLTVDAAGADEMAVAVGDGPALDDVDPTALTFQPYARQSIVLLPSGDGEKTVCVVLRDAAGNQLLPRDDASACATTTLDTTSPASPVVLSEEGQVLRSPANGKFVLAIAPLDSDVVRVEVTVEGPFDPRLPPPPLVQDIVSTTVITELQVDVLGDVDRRPTSADTPHLMRLTAIDRAGNESPQSTFTVTYDDRPPDRPTIADATPTPDDPGVVYPRQGRKDVAQLKPPKFNVDSFAVRIVTSPQRIDRNFDHYEVARTVGKRVVAGRLVVRTPRDGLLANGQADLASLLRPDPTDLPFTEAAGTDSLIVPLVQGAPLNGSDNGGVMCTPRACLNHIFVRAVDAAGNVGPELRIDIVEDSGPPTRPTLSPRQGSMVGDTAAIRLEGESVDDSDFCDDVADCAPGLACDKNVCVSSSEAGGTVVRAYELKQGTDGSFGGVPPGQPVDGPWRLQLLRGETNSVCARGVDDAGNVGIEDCVVVEEKSRAPRIALANQDDREPHLAGDWLIYRGNNFVYLNELAGPAPGAVFSDGAFDFLSPRNGDPSGGTGIDVGVEVVDGADVLAIAAQGGIEDIDVVQVHFGAPKALSPFFFSPELRRTFRGAAPTIRGREVTFACTAAGRTSILRAQLDRLYGAATPPAGVLVGSASGVQPSVFANCPAVDPSGAFTTVALLDAGKRLCSKTSPVSTNNAVAWCETSTTTGTEAGDIVVKFTGPGTPVRLAAAATSSHGALVDGGAGAPIRPLASGGRLVWVDAVTGTIHDLVAAPGAVARNTGVRAGDLYDIDGDNVTFANVRADELTDDLFLVDLRPVVPAAIPLSDDLPPNPDGATSMGRVATTSFGARGEDIELLSTSDDAWLASSDSLRFLPATSATRAAWVELVDDELALVSVDINSGEQATVARGDDLFARLTFVGGRFLGNTPTDLGGDIVGIAAEDDGAASWTASFFAVRGQEAPLVFTLPGLAPAVQPGVRDGTLPFDLDVDGDAVAFVEASTGNLVVRRISGSTLTTVLSVPSGRGATDAALVPFVSLDDENGLTAVVWQLGNEGTSGDFRLNRQGTIVYAERRGSTTLTAPVRAQGGGLLRGRAPSLAVVDGRVILAWQVLAVVDPNTNESRMRTRGCELVIIAGVPTCANERALDDARLGGPDSGRPVVSRRGFVAWPNGAGRSQPQVEILDFGRNTRISLTGGLDDGLGRDALVAAGDVVVWLDSRLGTNDVWYATVP